MAKGWREKRVYNPSIRRAVAPKHRAAAMFRRGRHVRRRDYRMDSKTYNRWFNKVPPGEEMYNVNILDYLWLGYGVPKEVSAKWDIPTYKGKLGKSFYWKREVDEMGRAYARRYYEFLMERGIIRGENITGENVNEVDAKIREMIVKGSKKDDSMLADFWRDTRPTEEKRGSGFQLAEIWREKPKSTEDAQRARQEQQKTAPYTEREYRQETKEIKKQRKKPTDFKEMKLEKPKSKPKSSNNKKKTIGGNVKVYGMET